MSARTTTVRVFGSSLVANPYAPLFKEYVYRGDQPLAAEPKKTRDDAPVCSEEGCNLAAHAVGMCPRHYYRYRAAVRKDPSLRKERKAGFKPDKCGTPAGHQRHLYWKQEPCQACKTAKTRYRDERRAMAAAKKEAAA